MNFKFEILYSNVIKYTLSNDYISNKNYHHFRKQWSLRKPQTRDQTSQIINVFCSNKRYLLRLKEYYWIENDRKCIARLNERKKNRTQIGFLFPADERKSNRSDIDYRKERRFFGYHEHFTSNVLLKSYLSTLE